MFRFLRAIGLKPIEWSEAISYTKKPAPFIGEILERAFIIAQAVIVILTGDDIAYLRKIYHNEDDPDYEKNPTPQARPNVIFEAGLAFGYKSGKTVLVQIGKTRPFSDIAGIHILNMDNSPQKRQELVSRLESAGCKIDDLKNKCDWLSEGDFEKCLVDSNDIKINNHFSPDFSEQKVNILDKLEDIEVLILKNLSEAQDIGSKFVTASQLSNKLNISLTKSKYYIKRLQQRKYIYGSYVKGEQTEYSIDQDGTEYLINNNIL